MHFIRNKKLYVLASCAVVLAFLLSIFQYVFPNKEIDGEVQGIRTTQSATVPVNCTTPLGIATDFNIFVLNNYSHVNGDAEGRVAVGGNGNFTYWAAGSKLPKSSTRDDLIVGGSLTFGQVNGIYQSNVPNGNIVYGTTTNIPLGYYTQARKDTVIDFIAAKTQLQNLSKTWSQISSNSTWKKTGNQIIFSGTDPKQNIFSIKGSEFSTNTLIDIKVPKNSSVLINISGTNINLTNNFPLPGGNLQLGQTNSQKIIYNFYESNNMQFDYFTLQGSVMAPFADISKFKVGHIEGNLVTKSLNANAENAETHLAQYNGCITSTTSPSTTPTTIVTNTIAITPTTAPINTISLPTHTLIPTTAPISTTVQKSNITTAPFLTTPITTIPITTTTIINTPIATTTIPTSVDIAFTSTIPSSTPNNTGQILGPNNSTTSTTMNGNIALANTGSGWNVIAGFILGMIIIGVCWMIHVAHLTNKHKRHIERQENPA